MKDNILIIGACGPIGTELTAALTRQYGEAQVLAADRYAQAPDPARFPNYRQLDALDGKQLAEVLQKYRITQVYLLAAVLSAAGEEHRELAWKLNVNGLLLLLNLALEAGVKKIFCPSSIAVFGHASPKHRCPQEAAGDPATIYGISKKAGEFWCRYYFDRYGVDIRSLRFPGLISHTILPGGGATDYAVDIFHRALEQGEYTCFLAEDRCLPMLYMPDAIRATLELMEVPKERVTIRTSYNLAGMSFAPCDLAAQLRWHLPGLRVQYAPDGRDTIAQSWPASVDDAVARQDWGWRPEYDLAGMTLDMLAQLTAKKDVILPARAEVPETYPDFPVENGMFS